MTSDDGTQALTIEAIERVMAVKGIRDGEMARFLGLSPSQWSNVKSGHQVLAPWMQRKISIRLGTAAPATCMITGATGEVLSREETEPSADAERGAIDITVLGTQLLRRLRDAGLDGRYDSHEQGKIFPLLRELDRLTAAIDARVASGRVA